MPENLKSDKTIPTTIPAPVPAPASVPVPKVIPKDIDGLLECLVADGYTNTIQNIIVLKRFNNDYVKAKDYLKSNAT